ncbi:MAG: ABC transporter permease [Clostridia bacterium]|nr:ABC transporter permease [Clostridia bacterium]
MKKRTNVLINAPYTLWSVIFIVVPLLMVVYFAFTKSDGSLTFANIIALKDYWAEFRDSILYALIATIVALLVGYPFAYALTKLSEKTQRIQMMLIMLPMWINFIIRTYGWKNILEYNGLINSVLKAMNLKTVQFLGPGAVILVMVYDYLPYMILPIYTVLSKMDPALTEAARDLGCNGFNVWKKVVLPLSVPGVVSGITMVFVPAISTFYISAIMTDNKVKLIGNIIEEYMKAGSVSGNVETNFNLGAAMSLVLAILILISIIIMNRFTDGQEEGNLVV